jgi:hypothetical protein
MRKLSLAILTGLLVACGSTDERPRRRYEPDPETDTRFAKGLERFAAAQVAAIPSEVLVEAVEHFALAAKKVPSPEHRFAHARTALLLAPDDAKAREELASCVDEEPDDPRYRALSALAQLSLSEAEKALDLAATASLSRAERCFVGEEVLRTVSGSLPRTRDDADKRGRLTLRAAELGSPLALVYAARLRWLSRKAPLMDWAKAREQAKEAAGTRFTPEEAARALLWRPDVGVRMGARELGRMLVEDGEFAKARPLLEQGLAVKEDLVDPNAVIALAELASIDAFALDGDATRKARGLAALRLAGEIGFTPALVRLAWLDAASRDALLAEARKRRSPGAYAAAGDWAGLLALLETQRESARTFPERLPAQRLLFFVRALEKRGAVRTDTEKEARELVENAREDTSVPVARQFRHIAGDLPADELTKTMRKSDHVPRWRAETELALATRCLLLADTDGAKAHLRVLLDAGSLFTAEDEIAWGALRALEAPPK